MTIFPKQLDLGVKSPGPTFSPVIVPDPQIASLPVSEPKGVVYTKSWVVDLILDLANYLPSKDLATISVVEPSSGGGAFLIPLARRLLTSLTIHGRPLSDAYSALRAYEIDSLVAERTISIVIKELVDWGAKLQDAQVIARSWVTGGDYLLESLAACSADVVIGNPPYIRYDDIPPQLFAKYRTFYSTMIGRSDIYVGFIEAGIRQLAPGGVLAFICADRWMRSSYGAALRSLISSEYGVEVVIEMHEAPAFEDDVAAYPSIIVIRRAAQKEVILATADKMAGPIPNGGNLANSIKDLAGERVDNLDGFRASRTNRWYKGKDPWPWLDPHRLKLLQELEEHFHPLEDVNTGTKVGIGVATGADSIYITKETASVEVDRLLPLAMSGDTKTGILKWSNHYLINPWEEEQGLIDLESYPQMKAYLNDHKLDLMRRSIAKQKPRDWYRTIDRVNHKLTSMHKLYFQDMKLVSNPTLDRGETYPHHNLYYVTSDTWDLEILGGLLLSQVAQLFIEAYCTKLRGGTLRFQAQYLRRIRVPSPAEIPPNVANQLIEAFRSRDSQAATQAALEAYGIDDITRVLAC
ncbi:MAG: SAM-dependent methyltransferase [Acidimicrobiales bacterium]|nr:SAM-dependent methyltransferase [Acidimicrobiales bacterium]